MSGEAECEVWLERSDGSRIAVDGNCALGRGSSNNVILTGTKVSRRHATIHVQNGGQFWLVDLGSSNGTYLNNRRIAQPVQLSNEDTISIGDDTFIFRFQYSETHESLQTLFAQSTVYEIRDVPCWFLLADLQDFTSLSGRLPGETLAMLIGRWMSSCKEVIERHGGAINKYLGDGFLAYWRTVPNTTDLVGECLLALKEFQGEYEVPFRLAIHYGNVAIGGVSSMGEESLIGREANFAFRLEKLAASIQASRLASSAAQEKLCGSLAFRPLGEHELKGFPGKYAVFSF